MSTIPQNSVPLNPQGMPVVAAPLVDGQRLSRAEFHHRYELMPELKKAELLDGVVYMSSPVSSDFHAAPDNALNVWLGVYSWRTPGVQALTNGTMILDDANEPQPDAMLKILRGGQTRTDEKGYTIGGVELAAEVSASSRSYDLGVKKKVYLAAGVREFIVWQIHDNRIDWFILRGQRYELLTADVNGIVKSETFPGLWLEVAAMLRSDTENVARTLEQGLATKEHQDFVALLASRSSSDI